MLEMFGEGSGWELLESSHMESYVTGGIHRCQPDFWFPLSFFSNLVWLTSSKEKGNDRVPASESTLVCNRTPLDIKLDSEENRHWSLQFWQISHDWRIYGDIGASAHDVKPPPTHPILRDCILLGFIINCEAVGINISSGAYTSQLCWWLDNFSKS